MDPFAHLLNLRKTRGKSLPSRCRTAAGRRRIWSDWRRWCRGAGAFTPKHRNPSPRSSSAAPSAGAGTLQARQGPGRVEVRRGRRPRRSRIPPPKPGRRRHRRPDVRRTRAPALHHRNQNHRPRHRDAAAPARLQWDRQAAAAPTIRDRPRDCRPDHHYAAAAGVQRFGLPAAGRTWGHRRAAAFWWSRLRRAILGVRHR